jgi:AcrR family transcriptional regulator
MRRVGDCLVTKTPVSPATRRPSQANPRVRRTRAGILATARELLAEGGIGALTYSVLAARANVTRQTLYRHWPTRAALLCDLILEIHERALPKPETDVAVVARDWLKGVRKGLGDHATRTAVAAVTVQADFDLDSEQALERVSDNRVAALNQRLEPAGIQITSDEYLLLCGPILARIFFDRRPVSDEFIDAAVAQWCESLRPAASSPGT